MNLNFYSRSMFIDDLQSKMQQALEQLDENMSRFNDPAMALQRSAVRVRLAP